MDKRVTNGQDIWRRNSDALKRKLVERSLEPGASVAAIALEAGVNANLLFNWRRLHLQAELPAASAAAAPVLLPVTVVAAVDGAAPQMPTPPGSPPRAAPAGTIEIDIHGARVRLRGAVDEASIRTVLRAGQRHMIGLPPGTRVWIVAGHTDIRKGFDGLAALVQTALAENPFKGHVFVFRGRRGEQPGKLTAFHEALKRALYAEIKAAGYDGGYSRVTDFIRAWRQGEGQGVVANAFVPLAFELGEAYQFDWSEEGLVVHFSAIRSYSFTRVS